MVGAPALDLRGDAKETGLVQPGGKMDLGGPNRLWGNLPVHIRLSRRQSHAIHSGVLQEDESQQAESREGHTGYKTNFIYVRIVRQCHKLPCLRGCAVFILGGFQVLTGSTLE